MKRLRLISMTLLMVLTAKAVTGQDDTQPLSPQLDIVTVDPLTGFATLRWLPSPSPDVGSYVIYTVNNSTAFAVDTVLSPYVTEYTHTGSAAKYNSVTYVIAAMDSSMNISPLSNSLSTIYLSAVNDTCNALIELSWTPYLNPAHPHENYDLWIGTGGVPAVLHETLSPSETSYNYTDIAPSTAYCFYLSASDNAGNVSTSNMQCITSGVETIPAWTTADAVSVENQELVVRGSYDRSTDINKFIVQLLNKATGKWVKAGTATGIDGAVIIAVDDADTSSINLYRIAAVNSCGKALAESPPVRNIVLTSSLTNTVIELKWNNPFTSHPARFTVWRDTGHGFSELPGNLSDTVITEDYTLFGEDVSVERIAYYVTAIAAEEPADALASISNISLIPAISNIFMPNAFTPDGDGLNDIFIPKLSFTPEDYEFRIYSRTGILLFRTGNDGTGWDGRYKGSMMPPGVYLWKLSYATQSGIREQRTGTVTILP